MPERPPFWEATERARVKDDLDEFKVYHQIWKALHDRYTRVSSWVTATVAREVLTKATMNVSIASNSLTLQLVIRRLKADLAPSDIQTLMSAQTEYINALNPAKKQSA